MDLHFLARLDGDSFCSGRSFPSKPDGFKQKKASSKVFVLMIIFLVFYFTFTIIIYLTYFLNICLFLLKYDFVLYNFEGGCY